MYDRYTQRLLVSKLVSVTTTPRAIRNNQTLTFCVDLTMKKKKLFITFLMYYYRLNIRFGKRKKRKRLLFYIQLHLLWRHRSETKMQTIFFYFDSNVLHKMTLKARRKKKCLQNLKIKVENMCKFRNDRITVVTMFFGRQHACT